MEHGPLTGVLFQYKHQMMSPTGVFSMKNPKLCKAMV